MISIMCYSLLFPVVFAFNMSIYSGYDFYYNENPEPVQIVEKKYEFEYHLYEGFLIDVIVKNKAPNDIATFYVTSHTNDARGDIVKKKATKCTDGDCLRLTQGKLQYQFISIGMQFNSENVPHIISEGKAILPDTTTERKDDSLCVKPRNCVMVIDLQNESGKDMYPQEKLQSTWIAQNSVYIFVIPSVIVILCVLGIYIGIKKFRNRSSSPEDTLELNTYATKNEVLYADLSFVQGNIQPPKHEEESPYAEIMGVLRPK